MGAAYSGCNRFDPLSYRVPFLPSKVPQSCRAPVGAAYSGCNRRFVSLAFALSSPCLPLCVSAKGVPAEPLSPPPSINVPLCGVLRAAPPTSFAQRSCGAPLPLLLPLVFVLAPFCW